MSHTPGIHISHRDTESHQMTLNNGSWYIQHSKETGIHTHEFTHNKNVIDIHRDYNNTINNDSNIGRGNDCNSNMCLLA